MPRLTFRQENQVLYFFKHAAVKTINNGERDVDSMKRSGPCYLADDYPDDYFSFEETCTQFNLKINVKSIHKKLQALARKHRKNPALRTLKQQELLLSSLHNLATEKLLQETEDTTFHGLPLKNFDIFWTNNCISMGFSYPQYALEDLEILVKETGEALQRVEADIAMIENPPNHFQRIEAYIEQDNKLGPTYVSHPFF